MQVDAYTSVRLPRSICAGDRCRVLIAATDLASSSLMQSQAPARSAGSALKSPPPHPRPARPRRRRRRAYRSPWCSEAGCDAECVCPVRRAAFVGPCSRLRTPVFISGRWARTIILAPPHFLPSRIQPIGSRSTSACSASVTNAGAASPSRAPTAAGTERRTTAIRGAPAARTRSRHPTPRKLEDRVRRRRPRASARVRGAGLRPPA